MFEMALAYSAPGAPIWMIGDSLNADCLPASSFGAKAILVRTPASFDCRADDLRSALKIIES
jgi:FMN phosphatase YigB (HAD superfamily)